MNEKEKKGFYVAMCKCCLLAQAMKSCPLCRFNVGLEEKPDVVKAFPTIVFTQVAMPEQIAVQ